MGWRGPWSTKYFLLRDRKTLITSPANMLAVFVLANFIMVEQALRHMPNVSAVPTIFETSALVKALLFANVAFLINRIFHRIYFTTMIYGALHGALAVPRLLVSNLINYFAASRAIAIFIDSRLTGRKVTWDKTAHSFPTGHGLALSGASATPSTPQSGEPSAALPRAA
jgi:adsorption protein B